MSVAPYLFFFLLASSVALVVVWSARFRATVARADGFSALTWRDFMPSGPRRPGSTSLAFALLRLEATARPEPAIEHLRRQLQSFKGQTIAMLVGGLFLTTAWAGLSGLPAPFGVAQAMVVEPVRAAFWTGVLLAMLSAWLIWVARRPPGFGWTLVAGLLATGAWLGALVAVGPPLRG